MGLGDVCEETKRGEAVAATHGAATASALSKVQRIKIQSSKVQKFKVQSSKLNTLLLLLLLCVCITIQPGIHTCMVMIHDVLNPVPVHS